MQVLYLKPLSSKIKNEMLKARNMILVEQNVTGQLGRLLREKTGLKIEEKNRILKYDARPFASDELREEIKKRLVARTNSWKVKKTTTTQTRWQDNQS